ncbi:MAG: GNAT family protein [Candidatus Gracilibacteria bacterium]|nr:GNAT family protein [Candidatus Gracilibacteria bacterium]
MKKLKITDKIETNRLIIEIPKISDASELYNLIDDYVVEFMYWYKSENYKELEKHIEQKILDCKKGLSWDCIIRLKEDNRIIGKVGIIKYEEDINSIELGYWIGKEFWGKGYIPECVEKFKNIGFNDLLVNRIVIIATKENLKSRKVAEKCGFKLDGIIRGNGFIKGKIVDKAIYTFLKEDFE